MVEGLKCNTLASIQTKFSMKIIRRAVINDKCDFFLSLYHYFIQIMKPLTKEIFYHPYFLISGIINKNQ